MQLVFSETKTPADASALGDLRWIVKSPDLLRELTIRQAELTDDRELAADLCLKLDEKQPFGPDRLTWAIRRLAADDRNADVVRILERHLRSGDRLTRKETSALIHAYVRLKRVKDAQRAATDQLERPQRVDSQGAFGGGGFGGGRGFFSVP